MIHDLHVQQSFFFGVSSTSSSAMFMSLPMIEELCMSVYGLDIGGLLRNQVTLGKNVPLT